MNSVAVYRFIEGSIESYENKKHKHRGALPLLYICKDTSYAKTGRVGQDEVHKVSIRSLGRVGIC